MEFENGAVSWTRVEVGKSPGIYYEQIFFKYDSCVLNTVRGIVVNLMNRIGIVNRTNFG